MPIRMAARVLYTVNRTIRNLYTCMHEQYWCVSYTQRQCDAVLPVCTAVNLPKFARIRYHHTDV